MPLFAPESTYPSREAKKVALSRLEGEVLDWMRDHGEAFPTLRDLCHESSTRSDKERENL